jgi:hypothetical protein
MMVVPIGYAKLSLQGEGQRKGSTSGCLLPHGTPYPTRSPNNDVDFLKIRTSMGREKIQIMQEAYASISSRGTVDRA